MRAPLCSTPCCCGAVAGATARSSASTRAASPPMGPCCHPALRLTSRWAWRWLCRTSWAPPWSPSTGKPGPVRAVPGWGGEGIPTCSPTTSARRSLAITLPEPPGDPPGRPPDLTAWLYGLTETMLPGLLRQADPQHVIETRWPSSPSSTRSVRWEPLARPARCRAGPEGALLSSCGPPPLHHRPCGASWR